ncbi:MAG TPA: LEA type 2 family protein [Cellvibrionaceae bacterium]
MSRLFLLALLVLLASCSVFQGGLEAPTVKVTGIEILPTDGFAPRFGIDLNVTNPNPNPRDLSVRGMSYSIAIADFNVLSGVSDQLPVLGAYRETPVRLELSADLVQTLRLIEYITRPQQVLEYRFSARLDLGSWTPDINISESGSIGFK